MDELIQNIDNIPENSKDAIIFFTVTINTTIINPSYHYTICFLQKVLKKVSSELLNVRQKVGYASVEDVDNSSIINNDIEVFSICESQITRCSRLMVDIFKKEIQYCTILQVLNILLLLDIEF